MKKKSPIVIVVIAFIALISSYGIFEKDDFINNNFASTINDGNKNNTHINNESNLNLNDCTTPHIEYTQLDKFNRVGPATACLAKENLGKSEGREQQRFKPTGWHQKKMSDGQYLINRGHLIAYSFSFNFNNAGVYEKGYDGSLDNPLNLVTQTQYSNQVEFIVYENKVRDALKKGKRVLYRVTPIFEGDNLMASRFKLEAVSEDKAANFSVTLENCQPGYTFDYATGNSKKS